MTAPTKRLDERARAATCTIPESIYEKVEEGLGQFFASLTSIDATTLVQGMLDGSKAFNRLLTLERYVGTSEGRVLEIGSGYGTNLIMWTKFGVDMTGCEPEGHGFSSTLEVSRELCTINGVDPQRIVEGAGENLPFPDATFDVAYSAYMLEHTADPVRVLSEALRVVKPGGYLHFELPNYLTPFEGHYMAIVPPVVWKPILPWYVKHVLRKDPHFATTMRTEINPFWVKRVMRELSQTQPNEIVSLGEDLFCERLRDFKFETAAVQSRLGALIGVAQALNRANWVARSLVLTGTFSPIVLTVRKK